MLGLPSSVSHLPVRLHMYLLFLYSSTNYWDWFFFFYHFFSPCSPQCIILVESSSSHWLFFYFQHVVRLIQWHFCQILYFSFLEFPLVSFFYSLRLAVFPLLTNILAFISLSILIIAKLKFLFSSSGIWVTSGSVSPIAFPLDYVSSNLRYVLDIVKNTW